MNSYLDKTIKTAESENHEDTIQVIDISKSDNGIFVTGGWDGDVKIWQINDTSTSSISNLKVELKMKFSFNEMVISLSLSNDNVLFIGLSNGQLKFIQLSNNQQTINVDSFSSAVIYIKWIEQSKMFLCFGADNMMKCYLRQNNFFTKVGQLTLPERTCCVDICYPYMAICSLYRYRIYRIDGDNIVKNDYSRYFDTPFEAKTKIMCASILPEGVLFLGSFDSHIANIPFEANTNILKHQTGSSCIAVKPYGSSKTVLTQVNAMKCITLNNSTSTLLIGFDKKLVIYSPQTHSEIKNFKTKNQVTAINILKFKGKIFLITATGNDWAQGMNSLSQQRKTQIQIKELKETDFKRY